MVQQQGRLLQNFRRTQHLEAALPDPALQRRSRLHHQRQQADVFRVHGAEGPGGVHGVLPEQLPAAQARNGRHRQGKSRPPGLLPCRHDGRGRVPLLHPLQHRITAGFQAHIHHFQAALPQPPQLLLRLDLKTPGRGVAGDPLTLRKQAVHHGQNFQQLIGFPHQGVAVGQKDPLHPAVYLPGQAEILPDLLHRPQGKPLIVIHIAEGAAVMAAPIGHLDDEAVCLAGGTVDLSLVSHGVFLLFLVFWFIIAYFSPFEKGLFCAAPA